MLSRMLQVGGPNSIGTGFSSTSYVYTFMFGDHWVDCEVHLDSWEIYVYNSTSDTHSDSEMSTGLHLLCYLLPHLLDQTSFYEYWIDADIYLDPFTYIWREDIHSQTSNSGDCGIFTCMFIQYLGLGISFDFGIEDGPVLRARITCDL